MGYARILNHLGEARYSVELDYGEERKQQRIAKLTDLIQQAEQQVLEREAELAAQAQRVAEIADTLNQATAAYVAALQAGEDGAALRAAVDEGSAILLEASLIRSQLENDLALAKARKLTLEKQRTEVIGIATLETRALWCGDYTTDLSGMTATCEIVGEQGEIVVYPPARREGGGNTQIDGFLLARGLMSPEQAFFNAAILPGWQKHRPKHRAGTITAINTSNDTASVTLDAIQSSAQSLDIQPDPATLTNVPIRYMDCDSAAFLVGDRVILEYSQSAPDSLPAVIGFTANPRECIADGFLVTGPSGVMYLYRDDDNQWDAIPVPSAIVQDGRAWISADKKSRIRYTVGLSSNTVRKGVKSAIGSNFSRLVAAAVIGDYVYALTANPSTGEHAISRGPATSHLTTSESVAIAPPLDENAVMPFARWPIAGTNSAGVVRTGVGGNGGIINYTISTSAITTDLVHTPSYPDDWGDLGRTKTTTSVYTSTYSPETSPNPGTSPWRVEISPVTVAWSPAAIERTVPIYQDGAVNLSLIYKGDRTALERSWTRNVTTSGFFDYRVSFTPSWSPGLTLRLTEYYQEWTHNFFFSPATDRLDAHRERAASFDIYLDPNNLAVWFFECSVSTAVFASRGHLPLEDITHLAVDPLTYDGRLYNHTVEEYNDLWRGDATTGKRRYVVIGSEVTPLDDLKSFGASTGRRGAAGASSAPTNVYYAAEARNETVVSTADDLFFSGALKPYPYLPPRTNIHFIHVPKSADGDTCVSFTFPDSDVTFNYLTGGDLPAVIGARTNYRPLNVV